MNEEMEKIWRDPSTCIGVLIHNPVPIAYFPQTGKDWGIYVKADNTITPLNIGEWDESKYARACLPYNPLTGGVKDDKTTEVDERQGSSGTGASNCT